MKKLIKGFTILAIIVVGSGLSSCYKKFDASTYAPQLNINGYTNSNQVASSALVSYWNFNGTLKDSLSSTTGTATGTSFTTGLAGQALQGANNAYVVSDVPDAIKALHSFTISTWINMPQNTDGAVGIIGIANPKNFWGNFDIFFDNGGTATTGALKVHMWNNGTSDVGTDAWEGAYTVNNPWGAWINVTVTYDDSTSTVTVYYNGNSVGTNTQAGFKPLNWTGVSQMVFGTLQFQTTPSLTTNTGAQDWASFLTGSLDDVKVYNRVLTGTEVNSIYALHHRGK